MQISMSSSGYITYNADSGRIETYDDKVSVVSKFGDKHSSREAAVEFRQEPYSETVKWSWNGFRRFSS